MVGSGMMRSSAGASESRGAQRWGMQEAVDILEEDDIEDGDMKMI